MMIRKLTFPALAILIMGLLACGPLSKNKTAEIPGNWDSISETNYSIHYPDSFIVDKLGRPRMEFALLSRHLSQEDPFRENINLVIQNLSTQTKGLDSFVERNENLLRTTFIDGKIIKSKRHKSDDLEYHEVIFSGKQNDIALKGLQHYWIKEGKAFILTYASEESQYDNYLDIATKVMDTFKIK